MCQTLPREHIADWTTITKQFHCSCPLGISPGEAETEHIYRNGVIDLLAIENNLLAGYHAVLIYTDKMHMGNSCHITVNVVM
jgi:hypothetical protein